MTSATALAKTPLHRCHLQLGARMVPFAGYEMPVQYTGVLEEAKRVRESAGLFDVSHMGQFSVRGSRPIDEVQKLVTNDLGRLAMGQAQYNMLCNEEGGVIDDLVVYRRSAGEVFICVNASNRRRDLEWMRSRLGPGVALEDLSDGIALLALQGPKAEAILSRAADPAALSALGYYWAAGIPVLGHPVYVSRTGYTGEDGFELYTRAEHAASLWEGLLGLGQKEGLIPCGLGARDLLRLEMGYPLHGHELSETISPLSAGLSWVVKLQKSVPFPGQDALRREVERGPARVLKAFRVKDRRIPRQGYRVADAGHRIVGEITSGTFSPHLDAPIALGFIDRAAASCAGPFHIEIRDSQVEAEGVKLPFVPSRTKAVKR